MHPCQGKTCSLMTVYILPRFKILEAVPAEVLQNPQLPRNKKAGSE
jgi:hypothetical protein